MDWPGRGARYASLSANDAGAVFLHDEQKEQPQAVFYPHGSSAHVEVNTPVLQGGIKLDSLVAPEWRDKNLLLPEYPTVGSSPRNSTLRALYDSKTSCSALLNGNHLMRHSSGSPECCRYNLRNRGGTPSSLTPNKSYLRYALHTDEQSSHLRMARHSSRVREHCPRVRHVRQTGEYVEREGVRNAEE